MCANLGARYARGLRELGGLRSSAAGCNVGALRRSRAQPHTSQQHARTGLQGWTDQAASYGLESPMLSVYRRAGVGAHGRPIRWVVGATSALRRSETCCLLAALM